MAPDELTKLLDDIMRRQLSVARVAVLKAVARGELMPHSCEVCGAKKTDAHHDDYSKPLEVRWLCRSCHMLHHAQERAS